jgi:hypothetical protein
LSEASQSAIPERFSFSLIPGSDTGDVGENVTFLQARKEAQIGSGFQA